MDTDTEALQRLAALRSGIAAQIGSADDRDLAALRAAIASVFSASYIVPEDRLYTSQASAHGELHARIDADHDERDDDAALVLERTDDGWRERPSRRLAFVPSVREEFLTEPDALVFPDPVQRVALPLSQNNETATQVLDQIRTSSAYSPKTRERLTPIEAIDGLPTPPCHTNQPCEGRAGGPPQRAGRHTSHPSKHFVG